MAGEPSQGLFSQAGFGASQAGFDASHFDFHTGITESQLGTQVDFSFLDFTQTQADGGATFQSNVLDLPGASLVRQPRRSDTRLSTRMGTTPALLAAAISRLPPAGRPAPTACLPPSPLPTCPTGAHLPGQPERCRAGAGRRADGADVPGGVGCGSTRRGGACRAARVGLRVSL